MSESYIGEIRMFAGNYAPQGWAFCDGSLLPISENDALFNLIGTTYGGDGQNTFALPDLRGRSSVHAGPGFALAQKAGEESVTLTPSQMPSHNHPASAASGGGNQASPAGAVWASTPAKAYAGGPANEAMAPSTVGSSGGSQPHDNLSPYVVVSYIISLYGIYPSPS